ncbi:MAG: NAD(P)H-dependent oxidoreductase [Candidatus Micrarchaeota archaeon]|nr:NAD(P)H-dependent oxidoreductase [Candidatus Micrarchaeota archaeon]
MLELLRRRFCAKAFTGEAISEEKVEQIIEAIRLAPSSYNLQPWRLKIIKDPETKEALYPASYNQKQILTASHIIVFLTSLDIDEILGKLKKARLKAGTPEAQVDSYLQGLREFLEGMDEQERRAYLEHQTYIALGFALIEAAYLGVDSCAIGGFIEKDYRKILGIPESYGVSVVLPLGKAAHPPRKKIRLEKEDIIL